MSYISTGGGGGGGSGALTVGTTTISGGTNTYLLYDNNGVLGEEALSLGLTVGTTTVASGTTGYVLYDNGGTLGNYAITGTGNVMLSASPTTTGTLTAAAITASGLITGSASINVPSGQNYKLAGATALTTVNSSNLFVGHAGNSSVTGTDNVLVGSTNTTYGVCTDLTSGSYNTVVGYYTTGITSGSYNTIIGYVGNVGNISNCLIFADGYGYIRADYNYTTSSAWTLTGALSLSYVGAAITTSSNAQATNLFTSTGHGSQVGLGLIALNSDATSNYWFLGLGAEADNRFDIMSGTGSAGTGGSPVFSVLSSGAVTLAGALSVPGGTSPVLTTTSNVTSGAGSSAGTLTNAPAVGNPTKWIPFNDNGTTRYIPAW